MHPRNTKRQSRTVSSIHLEIHRLPSPVLAYRFCRTSTASGTLLSTAESFFHFIIRKWIIAPISCLIFTPKIASYLLFFFHQVSGVCKEARICSSLTLKLDVDPLLPDHDRHQLRSKTGASSVAKIIKSWRDKCEHRHTKCTQPPSMRGRYPTRLLYIGEKDTVTVREYTFLSCLYAVQFFKERVTC